MLEYFFLPEFGPHDVKRDRHVSFYVRSISDPPSAYRFGHIVKLTLSYVTGLLASHKIRRPHWDMSLLY